MREREGSAKTSRRKVAQLSRQTNRLLHLEPFSGIAGNMFLAALLDLGLRRRDLEAELAALKIPYTLRVRRVRRGPIAAPYLTVSVPQRGRARGGRRYAEIRRLLERSPLKASIKERALATFAVLGWAEAKVHGVPLSEVHFHEVGAADAVVDICGVAAALDLLGIERVTSAPVALGSGQVETQHGRLPLPAPAALELLRGIPTLPASVAWETVTPTGAALLRTLVDEFVPLPAMTPEAVGYGAGDAREGPMPNVLRAVLGRSGGYARDRVVYLETHLDDFSPEHFDFLMERLFAAGALDVSLQYLQMKKNRPGFLVRVLCRPAQKLDLARILFAESTALGVRVAEYDRLVLARERLRIATPFGTIAVKLVRDPEGRVEASAEYDDCARAARKSGRPLREIVRETERLARLAGATRAAD